MSKPVRHAVLTACASLLLAACGGGDTARDALAREPVMASPQSIAGDRQASMAQALPAPEAADVPVLTSVPPATTDEPPTRLAAAASATTARASGARLVTPSIRRQTVATGLASPTDIALTHDGLLFHVERLQGLFVHRPGQRAVRVFEPRELAAAAAVEMLSVAADPDFARHRFVYVLARTVADGVGALRVIRLNLDESVARVVDRRQILVTAVDAQSTPAGRATPPSGGALRFGPDGFLYVGLGARGPAALPDAPAQRVGTVLRIDRDGKPAPAHRPPPGADARIFAHGTRDTVTLAFHPGKEVLLVGQRRDGAPDALTWIRPGADVAASVGWRADAPGTGLTAVERLRGPTWQAWRDGYAVAFDRAQRLDFVKFDAQGRVVQATTVVQGLGVGFKAVAEGPDGLYVVTHGKAGGDEIWRLLAN